MSTFEIDPGGKGAQKRKTELREDLEHRRQTIPADLKNTTQWKVQNLLRTLIADLNPGVVALYYPIREEIDLRPLAEELWKDHVTVALPRVVQRDHPLSFNEWAKNDNLEPDALGILCATGSEIEPAMLVIPALGYNRAGYRLGYGHGYYDRTLKSFEQSVITVGVAYTELEVEDFPTQYHDQPLDYFVTGKEVINCTRR